MGLRFCDIYRLACVRERRRRRRRRRDIDAKEWGKQMRGNVGRKESG
jgi:hypothetical protein